MKKLLLTLVLFLMFLPLSFASQNSDLYNKLLLKLTFDNANNFTEDTGPYKIDCNSKGSVTRDTDSFILGSASANIAGSGAQIYCDGSHPIWDNAQNFTVAIAYNITSILTNDYLITRNSGNANGDWRHQYTSGQTNWVIFDSVGDLQAIGGFTIGTSVWNFACNSVNITNAVSIYEWLNGSVVSNNSRIATFGTTDTNITIGGDLAGNQPINSRVDQVMIFNQSLNSSDCDFLYNNGALIDLQADNITPPSQPPTATYDPIAVHLNGTEIINGFKTFLNNTLFTVATFANITVDNIFGGNFFGNKIQANNLNVTSISPMTNDNILLTGNLNISGNLNSTGSIGATRFTGKIDCSKIDGGSDSDYCADAPEAITISRQIVMWRSDVQATGTANQGLNLPSAVTILDIIANGSCQKIDFTNDIGSELRCDVRQRTLTAGAGLVINVSLRYLENNTGSSNSVLCQRRNQGSVAKADLNISDGSNGGGVWFTKPSWFNGNKTLCVYTAGGNAVADFTFPYINLWTR